MRKAKNELPDEELMSLYQMGDFKAFESLYKRHSGRVFEYLKKKTSLETAQELMQGTFEKLHKSRDKYNSQYPFLPWLFAISRNALNDFFKKTETKLIGVSDASAGLLDNVAAPAIEPEQVPDLAHVLGALPQPQRQAIELRYLNDWSFERIATEMSTSQTNIRQLISRGLKKIRLILPKKGGL